MTAKSLPKQAPGRFKPGQSGNPSGRKPGTRARATILGEAIMQADADAIVKAVVEAAKAGDPTAMRLCVERLIPVRRGRPVTFALPKLEIAQDVGDALSAIVASMSRGELTPEEAQAVGSVLELRRKAIETIEMERLVDELEDANGKP